MASGFEIKSTFLKTLEERGFIQNMTDPKGLDSEIMSKGKEFTAYVGFDATADSLHVGSLTMIMMLRHLIDCRHKAVVVMGGATTRVGDPSGKDETRPMIDQKTIETNIAGIEKVIKRLLPEAKIVNNNDWLGEWNFMDFITVIGREFSVNTMTKRDVVSKRLDNESNMSFLEFNYMLLQAFDFMKLNETEKVTLQMGGSDQWGNIVSGVDLSRKKKSKKLFGLTTHLLTTADGKKMGKSDTKGAIWLDSNKTSVPDFWNWWRDLSDADLKKFLKLFTKFDLSEINEMVGDGTDKTKLNRAKENLATEVTAFVHGEKFVDRNLRMVRNNTSHAVNKESIGLLDLLVDTRLCSSNSDARRQIRGRSIRVDGIKIEDEKKIFTKKELIRGFKLSRGNKKPPVIVHSSC